MCLGQHTSGARVYVERTWFLRALLSIMAPRSTSRTSQAVWPGSPALSPRARRTQRPKERPGRTHTVDPTVCVNPDEDQRQYHEMQQQIRFTIMHTKPMMKNVVHG